MEIKIKDSGQNAVSIVLLFRKKIHPLGLKLFLQNHGLTDCNAILYIKGSIWNLGMKGERKRK